MAKVVIVGATGGLGSDLLEAFASDDVAGFGHGDVEITDPASVGAMLDREQPAVVVNTAAFHNVPRCETEPAQAYRVNAIGPRYLAVEGGKRGVRVVHVSTDYVFDGAKGAPYVEGDCPNPLNVYAQSKLAGEYAVLSAAGEHQVVRSSGLYGLQPCRAKGGNFIDTMFKVAAAKPEVRVVADEVLTPTFNWDLAQQIRTIAFEGKPGLYHATNHGQCSWYEFARMIFELGKIRTPLYPTSVTVFAAPVRRPFYSVLDNAFLRTQGLDRMRPWQEALTDYMQRRLARVL